MMNYHLFLMIIDPILEKEKSAYYKAGTAYQEKLNKERCPVEQWSDNKIALWLDFKWDILMGEQYEILKERYPLHQINAWEKRCNNFNYLNPLKDLLKEETEKFC